MSHILGIHGQRIWTLCYIFTSKHEQLSMKHDFYQHKIFAGIIFRWTLVITVHLKELVKKHGSLAIKRAVNALGQSGDPV